MGHEWSQFYITDAGRKLRTRAIAEKGAVHFSCAMVGEGKPENEKDALALEKLVSPAYPALVKRSFAKEYNHIMIIEINNQHPIEYQREVLVTEVAVSARMEEAAEETEVLYGYVYCILGDISIPPGASRNRIHQLVFDTKLSNATGVTITYDGSAVYMSHDEFYQALELHNTDPEAHPDLRERIDDLTSLTGEGLESHNRDSAAHPDLRAQLPTEHITTIEHQLEGVPLCTLYRTEDALGTLPFGEGPYGGGGRMDTPYRFRLLPGRQIEVYATPEFAELGTPTVYWNGTHQCNLIFDGSRTNLTVELRD